MVTAKGGEEGREEGRVEAENVGEGGEDSTIIIMVALGSCFILSLITVLACKQQCWASQEEKMLVENPEPNMIPTYKSKKKQIRRAHEFDKMS